jgi:peptidoglycan hydrolase-like protein with peptidoglycan-binding domain
VKKSTYPLRGIKIFGYRIICNPITKLRTVGKSPHVVTIQKKLKVTPASGFFGSKTYFAVKRFQKSKKLRDNGFVDKATWDALGL